MRATLNSDYRESDLRRADILLGLSIAHSGNEILYQRLSATCERFRNWDILTDLAEWHGLGPLLYTHLKASGVEIPLFCKRSIQGLYARHRRANAVREKAVQQILKAYGDAGIQTLVLKGAALAYTIYAEPGLRPMRDTDLLVPEHQAKKAQTLLAEMGFDISPDPQNPLKPMHPHLENARRLDQGMLVSVEVHYRLFQKSPYYPAVRHEDLCEGAVPFQIGDTTAYTLAPEKMLWHVYRHACGPPLLSTPLRFIHLADLNGLIETFYDRIDWKELKQHCPKLLNALPLLHCVTPWSDPVKDRLCRPRFKCPGPVHDYQGWPRVGVSQDRGLKRVLWETFFPEEWWVRFYYGVSGKMSRFGTRWLRHPMHLFECMIFRTLTRLKSGIRSE